MKKSQIILTAITIVMFVLTSLPLSFNSGKSFAETENNSFFFASDTLFLGEVAETGQNSILTTFLTPFGFGQIEHNDPGPPPPDTTKNENPEYFWIEAY
jgi:hypothetical protein